MEQRTRILHHTRSKTPIILAPSNSRPRTSTQTSKSANAKGREKAPLASLDTEVSYSNRRQSKSHDHNGSRSSSAGRRVPGSNRIVCRDFLKSDQISDRSGDDEEQASPRRSVPLRRHTMGSSIRPWTKSQEAPEPTSVSRMSSPPPECSSQDRNHIPKQKNWDGARQDIPNGPVVKLPTKNPIIGDETTTNSIPSLLGRTSKVSDSESLSNTIAPRTVTSENGFANSDLNQRHFAKDPKCPSRQDLTLHLQENTIPTSLPSQLANRDSINISSPVTSPVYSFSFSSQRQPHVHPPSSLNVHPSTLPSPCAVISPTSSAQRNCLSPQANSGYCWKTDPRRRPFQASGEFSLSPGDGSDHMISPQHAFPAFPPPTIGTKDTHISSPMYAHTSPYSENSSIANVLPNGSDWAHDKNPYSTNNANQQEYSNTNCEPSKGLVNSSGAVSPGSPTCCDMKQPLYNRKSNSLRRDASSRTLCSPSASLSYKSPVGSNPSLPDQGSYTTYDISAESSVRSSPSRQISSPLHSEASQVQRQSNHNLTFPRRDHKNKTNKYGTNSLNRENKPRSTDTQGFYQTFDNSFHQNSKIADQSRFSENNRDDPHIPYEFCRKRNSMRLATEGYGEMSHFSHSIDYADLPGSRNTDGCRTREDRGSRSQSKVKQSQRAGLPNRTGRQSENSEKPLVPEVQHDVKNSESEANNSLPGPFVRGCRQRDSYRLATSASNPDLLTATDQEGETFISCEDILSTNQHGLPGKSTPMSKNEFLTSSTFQTLRDTKEQRSNKITSPSSKNLITCNNSEIFSRIKRNSLRLATASLSDLSIILDEIDIGEPPDTPVSNHDVIEYPSPIFIRNGIKLSPLVERSLERSGSSVSSRNSSSFGSFYSCQSIGHTSAKNSPNHTSSHSSPRDTRPKVSTPDSVHKLMAANAHDSGISQSSEDTNSYRAFANTSISSSEEMEYGVNQRAPGGSLNRKRQVFYWTRPSPYPRQNHNTIPASWKPKEYSPSESSIQSSPRYTKSGSIRSYGSTSSVESSSSKKKPPKHLPLSSQILQRYGCGLDKNSPKLCTRGSTDSLTHKTKQPIQQRPSRNGIPSGNRENFTLPLPSKYTPYNSDGDFDRCAPTVQSKVVVSPTFIVESPTTDTPRSPPSLGRPKRKLYAGFDSQPLPMDTFYSDSSSVCTDVSYSSHGTDLSGQPDSGNFDESFYSIDNRSVHDDQDNKDCAFEASLTPKDYMNLTEINKNSQLRYHRSNSLHSTSTAKDGDEEDSEDDGNALEETLTPYQNQQTHQHVWPGTNYNQNVTSSLPMTFSI